MDDNCKRSIFNMGSVCLKVLERLEYKGYDSSQIQFYTPHVSHISFFGLIEKILEALWLVPFF